LNKTHIIASGIQTSDDPQVEVADDFIVGILCMAIHSSVSHSLHFKVLRPKMGYVNETLGLMINIIARGRIQQNTWLYSGC